MCLDDVAPEVPKIRSLQGQRGQGDSKTFDLEFVYFVVVAAQKLRLDRTTAEQTPSEQESQRSLLPPVLRVFTQQWHGGA